jgi:polysaccharide export outer membrane protein
VSILSLRGRLPRYGLAAILRLTTGLASLAVAATATGCAGTGPYVWYSALPANERIPPAAGQFLIGVGDTINVRVYEQPALATDGKIRPDGKIALPFVGEVLAAGKTPKALAQEIEIGLRQFIVGPRVTVNVVALTPMTVSVIGEVAKQGAVTLEPSSGVLQALAQSGGPTDFADKSRIFVLRRLPTFQRIRFTYENLVENRDGAALFPLQNGDIVQVQ